MAISKAKPKEKPYKLPDEKGLFVLVHPNGGK
ncbi:MAG TPA: integrase, partial [Nitrosomonas nitrosa]|nr:integrase [Nitrosomonas nitrosa]